MRSTFRCFAFVACLVCSRGVGAEPEAPKVENPEATAAKHVVRLIETQSLGKWAIDDARAKQLLQAFIARLDPHKLIFLQSDWTEFQEHEKLLDDQLKAGDLSFVKQVFRRFHLRAGESHLLGLGALDQEHDFTAEDVWPFPFADFAGDRLAIAERWRLRLKGEILFEKANDSSLEAAKAFLRERYENSDLHRRCMTVNYLESSIIDVLCSICDPEQAYLGPEENPSQFTKGLIGPKYVLNLRLWPLRLDRPCIREVAPARYYIQQIPVLQHADLHRLIAWDLVAMRPPAGKTQHLVGICHYEPWALSRALEACGNSPEVVLELQHPTTLERKSVTWPQSEKKNKVTPFAHFGPLKPQPQSVLVK